jgi:hydrogenase-4 component E
MTSSLYGQAVDLTAGVLLLTSVFIVWRHAFRASIRLLALQGIALALLAALVAVHSHAYELLAVAVMIAVFKGGIVPAILMRSATVTAVQVDESRLNPTASLIFVSLLTALAYVVGSPLLAATGDPALGAVPVGLAMVLIGFLQLVTRRRALSQMVGFVLLDNGIAVVAFLTAGGVPLVVELGASLDVLLIVLILRVLTGRMQIKFGGTDLDELRELRD